MTETTLEGQGGTLLQLTSFQLGAEAYAVDLSSVQEIGRMSPITSAPRFVEGVINLRLAQAAE